MTKQSGLGNALYLDGYNLSGDINSLTRAGAPMTPNDVTGIDVSARERIGGQRDGVLTAVAYFNPASSGAHPVLSTLPRTDRVVSYLTGLTVGSPAACIVAKQVGYDGTRASNGDLTFSVEAQGNGDGLEWCELATAAPRTDTAATNGTGFDAAAGASSAFGLQAYLHVSAFTGTSVTVKLQHSNDDAATDPYADVTGATFSAVTAAPTAQRLATASGLTVKRWLRVVTTGTFSSAVFVLAVNRNLTATVF